MEFNDLFLISLLQNEHTQILMGWQLESTRFVLLAISAGAAPAYTTIEMICDRKLLETNRILCAEFCALRRLL